MPRERLQRGISEYVFLGGEDSEFLRNCSERRNVFNINHIELNDALRGVRREGAGIFVTKDFRFGTESVRCSTVRLCSSYSMIVFFLFLRVRNDIVNIVVIAPVEGKGFSNGAAVDLLQERNVSTLILVVLSFRQIFFTWAFI